MNLIWLDDFLALAASGNFSRAAEDRHSSQPAFSRRIRALEEWIGADLFDRSSQPARLTEVGEWFADVARELIARVARVPEDARKIAETNSVTLRIASTHALSFTFLPRWLRSLESNTTLGPVQLMSDVLERCEALMLRRTRSSARWCSRAKMRLVQRLSSSFASRDKRSFPSAAGRSSRNSARAPIRSIRTSEKISVLYSKSLARWQRRHRE